MDDDDTFVPGECDCCGEMSSEDNELAFVICCGIETYACEKCRTHPWM